MTHRSRRTYLRTALVGGAGIVAGCIGDDVARETTPEPTGEIGDPPDLLVLADGETDGGNNHAGKELSRLAYAEGDETYEVAATYVPEGGRRVTSVATFGDGYAVTEADAAMGADRSRLAVLDAGMDPRETRDLAGHHTLATDGGAVHTASADGFRSFDSDLNPLGEASLPDEYAGKHMEDVLVDDGVAYVVDNVVAPKYLFRIDVSDPAAPSYLEVLETTAVGQSLHQQWLDPDANRWRCLQSTSHRRGGEQYVIVTPMEYSAASESLGGPDDGLDRRPDHEVRRVQIHAWTRDGAPDDVAEDRNHGTRIEDVASTPPVYAAVDDGEDYSLSSVDVDGTDVAFGREVTLGGPARVDSVPGTAVALAEDGRLSLFDTDDARLGHVETAAVENPLELAVLDP